MKSIELLAIGIRLLGIYMIVLIVQTAFRNVGLLEFVDTVSESASSGALALLIAQLLFMAMVCLILLKFPVTVSKWLLPRTRDDEVLLTGTAQDVQTALFCVLGVWLVITSVPQLIENVLLWWQLTQSGAGDQYSVEHPYLIYSIGRLIEAVIGLLLCLKSGSLSQLLYRLRTAGLKD
jgi:hypothetical protein